MIYPLSAGTSNTEAFAAIVVTYPEGSSCYCTDGIKLFTARRTEMNCWIFTIPYAGTWTIRCSRGTETASQSVVVDEQGKIYEITMVYQLILYDNGNQHTEITGGWLLYNFGDGLSSLTDSVIMLHGNHGQYNGAAAITNNLIPLADYRTMKFIVNVKAQNGLDGVGTSVGLCTDNSVFNGGTIILRGQGGLDIGERTVSVDISSAGVTQAYVRPAVYCLNADYKKIWLE